MEGSRKQNNKINYSLLSFLCNFRMKPLPDWVSNGAIVALGGGSQEVMKKVNLLLQSGCPVAGVWMQDWVGTRNQSIYGMIEQRLWWNWEVDDHVYFEKESWNFFL